MSNVRPFLERDRLGVRELLSQLGEVYPGGKEWLISKLANKENNTLIFVAEDGEYLCGVIILTLKFNSEIKISNLYVLTSKRKMGNGAAFLRLALAECAKRETRRIYFTLDEKAAKEAEAFFLKRGFKLRNRLQDRYRIGSAELVYDKFL